MAEAIEQITEDWTLSQLIHMPVEDNQSLVNYFFVNSKMICVYSDFTVQEIDLNLQEVTKTFNLQEIEGFEISEEVEEDKAIAFVLEKDVMLVSIACVTQVHIFEYSEDEEKLLNYIACVPKSNVSTLLFVDYHLLMVQDLKENDKILISCWDPDSESVQHSSEIERDTSGSKAILQSGSECIYFTQGLSLGKIGIPSMEIIFKVDSGHSEPIIDMEVTNMNQIITSSKDTDIRFFNIFNGQKAGQPLQDMECDHLSSQGIYLLTRIGNGEAMLVWKILPTGGVEECPVGEVDLNSGDSQNTIKFCMKSGVSMNQEGQEVDNLVMMNLLPSHVKFDKITRS